MTDEAREQLSRISLPASAENAKTREDWNAVWSEFFTNVSRKVDTDPQLPPAEDKTTTQEQEAIQQMEEQVEAIKEAIAQDPKAMELAEQAIRDVMQQAEYFQAIYDGALSYFTAHPAIEVTKEMKMRLKTGLIKSVMSRAVGKDALSSLISKFKKDDAPTPPAVQAG